SRETSPFEPAVVTIAMIHGGTAFNIIPEQVDLRGTVRAFDPALREQLLARVAELARTLGTAFGAEIDVATRLGCPAGINDAHMADVVRAAGSQELGAAAVEETPGTTWGDDMADFLAARPGGYFFVGSGNPGRGLDRAHHNPGFDFDEEALEVGTRVLARAALLALADPALQPRGA